MHKSRIIVSYLFALIIFSTLILRYAYLQLVTHNALLTKAIANYSSIVSTMPVRGNIVDKDGIIIADNKLSYVAAILTKDSKNSNQLFKLLSPYVNITDLDKNKYYKQLKNAKKYDFIVIKDDLSNIEIANLTTHYYLFPFLNVYARTKRSYPFSELYAHSVGYVARLSVSDLTRFKQKNLPADYLSNDYIGKGGLEFYYENYLRGKTGKKIIQTDALGNEVGLIANISANDGYSIKTTLDNQLQQKAWQLLGNHNGAIVAIDPNNGGILAFVSKPSYDPNWFIDGISSDDWEELRDDPNKPLLNRAIQGTYPPGSTFKPFLALAALYLGIRTQEWSMNDPGYFIIPGSTRKFRDSSPHGFGVVNMAKAIQVSSDAYFYKLALDMGIDKIDRILPFFRLGLKTGIDLPNENSGLLPSRSWKARRFKHDPYQKNWLAADSVTVGIGQGFNHYTPLQMANAVSILANNGIGHKPHLLAQIIDKNTNVVYNLNESSTTLPMTHAQITFIKSAMAKVVSAGTLKSISYGLKYTMAGKTGTAQVVGMEQGSRKSKFQGVRFRDHAWIIAFAPIDKPKIAVAIILENGGWSWSAAPIVRSLFDFYLLSEHEKNN